MLLRWLVNNYLRDAAQGKVREVMTDVLQGPGRQTPKPSPTEVAKLIIRESNPSEPRDHRSAAARVNAQPSSSPDTFLPCEAVFIFALGIESGGLVDRLKGAERSRHAHGTEHAGKLTGREVVIVDAGLGAKAAARATAEAIRFYQPKWIVSAGFAGALSEQLRRGHILMADEVVSLTGQRLAVGLKLDATTAATTKGLHIGRLLTVNDIIRRPADRRRLAAEHGAIACDMETFAVAEVCAQHGLPLLAIRVISDAVDDELPPEIEHLLAQKSLAGKLGAAAGAVFRRPSAAKDLWRLREDAVKASDRLAKFLVGVVEQLPKTSTE